MSELNEQEGGIEFRDSDGVRWEVREIPAPDLKDANSAAFGDYSRGWLLFSSDQLKKRLAPYPENWRTLSPYELEKWCWRAEPGRRPGAPGPRPGLRRAPLRRSTRLLFRQANHSPVLFRFYITEI